MNSGVIARTSLTIPLRSPYASDSGSTTASLPYDNVGPSVSLRPTSPAAFRRAIRETGSTTVQELTLLGFSEHDVSQELYEIIHHLQALHTLRIVCLDLWSGTHLQSINSLAVGPAMSRLVVAPHLKVLHLQRTCMGRTPAHVQALAQALTRHPNLQVLCIDVRSNQMVREVSAVDMDPLMQALATCEELDTLQIYLSGYQRGLLSQNSDTGLATLVTRLQELSLHMVSLPRGTCAWTQALAKSTTLQVWHCTHASIQQQANLGTVAQDVLRENTSLHSVSLSVPANERAACWNVIAKHPQLSAVSLSLGQALLQVPAFGKNQGRRYFPVENDDDNDVSAEGHAMALALTANSRLVHVPESHASLQALLTLNQGPRPWYLSHENRWWNLVAEYSHNVNALWLLLRLNPQCVYTNREAE